MSPPILHIPQASPGAGRRPFLAKVGAACDDKGVGQNKGVHMVHTMTRLVVGAVLALGAPVALADEPGVTMEIERTSTATPEEMQAFADAAVSDLQSNAKALAKLAEDARKKSKDGKGLPCVDDSLSAVQMLLEVSASARAGLDAALSQGAQSRAGHELRKLAAARDGAAKQRTEAEQCALGAGVQTGNTKVRVEGDVGDPDADTRALSEDLLDYAFDPTSASPF